MDSPSDEASKRNKALGNHVQKKSKKRNHSIKESKGSVKKKSVVLNLLIRLWRTLRRFE